MRIVLSVISALFGIYVVVSALLIANIGVTYSIPQLEAAGTAECIVAILCWVGAGVLFWKPWFSAVFFFLSTAWAIVVEFIYLDNTLWIWSAATFLLGSCAIFLHIRKRRKQRQTNLQIPLHA